MLKLLHVSLTISILISFLGRNGLLWLALFLVFKSGKKTKPQVITQSIHVTCSSVGLVQVAASWYWTMMAVTVRLFVHQDSCLDSGMR